MREDRDRDEQLDQREARAVCALRVPSCEPTEAPVPCRPVPGAGQAPGVPACRPASRRRRRRRIELALAADRSRTG